MKAGLTALLWLICGTALAMPDGDTLQGWTDLCKPNGNQQEITACAIMDRAEADDALEAVLAEIERHHATYDANDDRELLRAAQAGWEAQMNRDVDALYPVPEGVHPSKVWGSSWVITPERLRTTIVRQRIAFLCETWLPDRVRVARETSSCHAVISAVE